MFLLSGSMHLGLEVLLTVEADEEVSLMETERIRLIYNDFRFIIYLLFSTVIILFIFILLLYQCPPIKSTSVLKLPSVNCTCA